MATSKTFHMHKDVFRALAVVALGVLVAAAVLAISPRPHAPADRSLGGLLAVKNSSPNPTGQCGSAGVHVTYTARWSPSLGTFGVTTATVSGLDEPGCSGATVTVALTDGQSSPAAASADINRGASSETVSFAPSPAASAVTEVSVAICRRPPASTANCSVSS